MATEKTGSNEKSAEKTVTTAATAVEPTNNEALPTAAAADLSASNLGEVEELRAQVETLKMTIMDLQEKNWDLTESLKAATQNKVAYIPTPDNPLPHKSGFITAERGGEFQYFSEETWALLGGNTAGWRKVPHVPVEIQAFRESQ